MDPNVLNPSVSWMDVSSILSISACVVAVVLVVVVAVLRLSVVGWGTFTFDI